MSKEIKDEQKEMLNDVQNMNIPEKRYSDNSGLLYKNIIKNLRNRSKGELLLRDEVISIVRNEYEKL